MVDGRRPSPNYGIKCQTAMIRFASVTKTFQNGKTALKQVSFEIADGEMVGIIGPSGSGKTTVLKLLINEIIPTEGEISVDDFQVHKLNRKKLPQLRRTIGSVFQDFKILTDRTVAENVGLILEILDLPDKQIAGLLKEINNQGTTVIVATHDKNILDFLKPRILQLEAGELIL